MIFDMHLAFRAGATIQRRLIDKVAFLVVSIRTRPFGRVLLVDEQACGCGKACPSFAAQVPSAGKLRGCGKSQQVPSCGSRRLCWYAPGKALSSGRGRA